MNTAKREGREKGLAEGRTEGRAEGRIETLEYIVVDCKLNGFSIQQIQSITKLSEGQIDEILKKKQNILHIEK